MVSNGHRGLAHSLGDWHHEIEACSPAAIAAHVRPLASQPRESKLPSKKISIADYKKLKKDGPPRPTSQPSALTTASLAPTSRGLASDRADEPKCSSSEADLLRRQLASFKAEAREIAEKMSYAPPSKSNRSFNGNVSGIATSKTDMSSQKSTLKPPIRTAVKHPLPPRPLSPRSSGDLKSHPTRLGPIKRPLDYSSSSLHAAKRSRIEVAASPILKDQRIPKYERAPEKIVSSAPSAKFSPKPSSASPRPQKAALPPPSASRSVNTSHAPRKLTPIPPLLSPLPDDLYEPSDLDLPSSSLMEPKKKQPTGNSSSAPHHAQASKAPKKTLPIPAELLDDGARSRSSSPVFVHPPLLSPNLPPIVERELARLQKKATSNLKGGPGVETLSRLDTPIVARKSPKVGHPPKKTTISKSRPAVPENELPPKPTPPKETKKKFLVRIKYKKRRAKDIERILRMTPKVPSARFQELEAERVEALKSKSRVVDQGMSRLKAKKNVPSSSALPGTLKKRPADVPPCASPPAKRARTHLAEAAKSQAILDPPFKSPAPPKISHHLTPQKSHSKRASKMGKASSTDSTHAHTPGVTTPASRDKRTINTSTSHEKHQDRPDATRYIAEALSLKRKMDTELKTKDVEARKHVLNDEKQRGLCTGIECLLAYYSAFSVKKENRPSDRVNSWESTLGLLEFVVRNSEPYYVLHTLAAQLHALATEQLNRSYIDHVSVLKEAPRELLEKMVKNAQSRDRYWTLAHKGHEVLEEMGYANSVGPWTSWRDARHYFLSALEAYDEKEELGWKPSFSRF
ncbi:hypothetical protein BGT96224_1074 [Blumeria graminis f. sp. tritici 96224]|uniref:Uncharacterized protein n=1 Tax=Blumeria graminis f. sp. tritici 96224 TaxID=1268274 RepID=A0A656KJ17_BLUGR|nr:hypothetical protein BGT96224_1074 [Blumeria graminis f. sp. tritici 96224]